MRDRGVPNLIFLGQGLPPTALRYYQAMRKHEIPEDDLGQIAKTPLTIRLETKAGKSGSRFAEQRSGRRYPLPHETRITEWFSSSHRYKGVSSGWTSVDLIRGPKSW